MSYNKRVCFMWILLPRCLVGRPNVQVASVTFGFRESVDFGGQQRQNIRLNYVASCLRIVYEVILPSPTTLLRRLRWGISFRAAFPRNAPSMALIPFFFLAFVGGALYYAWYKKNVLDKVSIVWIEAPDTDYHVDRTSVSRRLRSCIGISPACKGFI